MVYLPLPDPAILFPGSLTSNDLAGNVHRPAAAETYNSGVGPSNQSPPRQKELGENVSDWRPDPRSDRTCLGDDRGFLEEVQGALRLSLQTLKELPDG
jgi:hypothetical protein